jgi:hypothetical protein
MKRLAVLIGCMMFMTAPAMFMTTEAMATSVFNKQWKAKHTGDDSEASKEFKTAAKKAGCNICHVKGKKKKDKDSRNEYGRAVNKTLKAKDFPKAYVKANPEEAKQKILEGFKKAAEAESKDGKKFGEKIKNNELPATDAGI